MDRLQPIAKGGTYAEERNAVEQLRNLRREQASQQRARTSHDSKKKTPDHSPSPARRAHQEELSALMTVVGHTNYPAMLELFTGSGAPPAGSNTDVNVSFELFESVQKRATATREELDATKAELVRSKDRIVHLQTECGMLTDRGNSLERQLKESEEYNKQLRQLSTDAALLKAQHDDEQQALRDELNAAHERMDKLQQQLTETSYKVSDAQVVVAQRDSVITNLRRERDELIKRLRSREATTDPAMKKTESSAALLRLKDAAKALGSTQQVNQLKHTLQETEQARRDLMVDLRAARAARKGTIRRSLIAIERQEMCQMMLHDIISGHECQGGAVASAEAVEDVAAEFDEEVFTPVSVMQRIENMAQELKEKELPKGTNFYEELDVCRDSAVSISQTSQECLRLMARFEKYLAEAITLNEVKHRWGRIEQRWFHNVNALAKQGFVGVHSVIQKFADREEALFKEIEADSERRWEEKVNVEYVKRVPMETVACQTHPPDGSTIECQAGPSFFEDRRDAVCMTKVVRGPLDDVEKGTWTDVDFKIPDWVERLPIPPQDLQGKPRELFDAFPKHLLVLHVRLAELAQALRKVLGITAAIADPALFMKQLNVVPTIRDAYEIVHFDEELINTLLSSLLISKDEATQRLLNYKRKTQHYAMERTIEAQKEDKELQGARKMGFSQRQDLADFKKRKGTMESDIARGDAGHERLQQAVEDHLYGDEALRQRLAQGSQTAPKARHERHRSDDDSDPFGTMTSRRSLESFDWESVRNSFAASTQLEELAATRRRIQSYSPDPSSPNSSIPGSLPGSQNLGEPRSRDRSKSLMVRSPYTSSPQPERSPQAIALDPGSDSSPKSKRDSGVGPATTRKRHSVLGTGAGGNLPAKRRQQDDSSSSHSSQQRRHGGRSMASNTHAAKPSSHAPTHSDDKRSSQSGSDTESSSSARRPSRLPAVAQAQDFAHPIDVQQEKKAIEQQQRIIDERLDVSEEMTKASTPHTMQRRPSWTSSGSLRPDGSKSPMGRTGGASPFASALPDQSKHDSGSSLAAPSRKERKRSITLMDDGSEPESPFSPNRRDSPNSLGSVRRHDSIDSIREHEPPILSMTQPTGFFDQPGENILLSVDDDSTADGPAPIPRLQPVELKLLPHPNTTPPSSSNDPFAKFETQGLQINPGRRPSLTPTHEIIANKSPRLESIVPGQHTMRRASQRSPQPGYLSPASSPEAGRVSPGGGSRWESARSPASVAIQPLSTLSTAGLSITGTRRVSDQAGSRLGSPSSGARQPQGGKRRIAPPKHLKGLEPPTASPIDEPVVGLFGTGVQKPTGGFGLADGLSGHSFNPNHRAVSPSHKPSTLPQVNNRRPQQQPQEQSRQAVSQAQAPAAAMLAPKQSRAQELMASLGGQAAGGPISWRGGATFGGAGGSSGPLEITGGGRPHTQQQYPRLPNGPQTGRAAPQRHGISGKPQSRQQPPAIGKEMVPFGVSSGVGPFQISSARTVGPPRTGQRQR